jgi:hypothetical protein
MLSLQGGASHAGRLVISATVSRNAQQRCLNALERRRISEMRQSRQHEFQLAPRRLSPGDCPERRGFPRRASALSSQTVLVGQCQLSSSQLEMSIASQPLKRGGGPRLDLAER